MFLLGAATTAFARRTQRKKLVWQLDPAKCTQCSYCATHCVLEESAVKCVQLYPMCGYCKLCTGYFEPQPNALNTGAENQLCPLGALNRRFVEDPYYEYTVDESLCDGCGKCVKACKPPAGNGSLRLEIRYDRCVECNSCSIQVVCPESAIARVSTPGKTPAAEGRD